jgi:hypothetical protein
VQTFDALARISARLIISTTNLMFLSVCTFTWHCIATKARQASPERWGPFFQNVADDNKRLHRIGGWTLGVVIIMHVWSLFLPSIAHGYANVFQQLPFSVEWPAQVSLGSLSQVDTSLMRANWGSDDVWRLTWMTVMFGLLFPLSRSSWLLNRSFSLAMYLHLFLGIGVFIDSARRRTHPHVWVVNIPFFAWYLVDKVLQQWHCKRGVAVQCTALDPQGDYVVLTWKNESTRETAGDPIDDSRSICDIYWFRFSRSSDVPRAFELAHPFTVASSFDVPNPPHLIQPNVRPTKKTIEAPMGAVDPHWKGHKFRVHNHGRGGNGGGAQDANGDTFVCSNDGLQRDRMDSWVRFADDGDGKTPPPPQLPTGDGMLTFQRSSTDTFDCIRDAIDPHTYASANDFDQLAVVKVQRPPRAPEDHPPHVDADRVVSIGLLAEGEDDGSVKILQPLLKPKAKSRGTWTLSLYDTCLSQAEIQMDIFGPYCSEHNSLWSRLSHNPSPIVIIATGAGANFALDVVSHLRRRNTALSKRVEIIYSTDSIHLLQFVTNAIAAVKMDHLYVSAALTKTQAHLEAPDPKHPSRLTFGRIDLSATIDGIEDPMTTVHFCGARNVSAMLQKMCVRKGLQYFGSFVGS